MGSPDCRIEDIIRAGTSECTLKAHESDLKYFWAWAKAADIMSVPEYPVPEDVVIRFITDHLDGMDADIDRMLVESRVKRRLGVHSVSTVERRLASLSYQHAVEKVDNPCRGQQIRLLFRKAKAARVAAGHGPKKKRAIIRNELERILETFGNDITSKRDRAVLLFAFASGGRRRSEVSAARFEDLEPRRGGFVYHMPRSKNDQEGKGYQLPVKGRAARALKNWISATGISDGYLFRSIRRGEVTEDPMPGETVNQIVKQRVEMIGLNPEHYGAHSLRSGFMTEAGRQEIYIGDAMQLSTHKTVQTAMSYYEVGKAWNNPGGRILD